MNDTVCKICGGKEFVFLFKAKDRFYHLDGSFDLYRCKSCGLVFVHPFLTQDELGRYYPQDYYSYETAKAAESGSGSKAAYYMKHPVRAANAIIYSKLLKHNAGVPVTAGSAVLDVGCGDGGYLEGKIKAGCRIYGVDISEGALKRLKDRHPAVIVYCGNLWEAGFPEAHFDLIHLSHVLEHVTEIDKLAQEIRRILKPGGRVSVQVPNSASLTKTLFGRFWMHWDAPRHVYAFSKKNLARFFRDQGFRVERSRTLENSYSVLGSLVYVLNAVTGKKLSLGGMRGWWDSEWMKLLLSPYALFVNMAGAGDTMEFILTREGG